MLHFILGLILKDRKRDDDICRITGVTCVIKYAKPDWCGMDM